MISVGKTIKTDDSRNMQSIDSEFFEDEVVTVKRIQPYGLSSNPPRGSTILTVSSGSRDSMFAISAQDNERPKKLNPGDVTLYNGKSTVKLRGEKVLVNDVDILQVVADLLDFLVVEGANPTAHGKLLFSNQIKLMTIRGQLNGK